MTVFEVKFNENDIDWIYAKNLEDTKRFYDNVNWNDVIITQKSLRDKLWYGIDVGEPLWNFYNDSKNKDVKIKSDERGDFDYVIYITFEKAIEIGNITSTHIIASTIW